MKRFRQWPLLITCLVLAIGAFWASQSEHDWALSQRSMVEAHVGVQEGDKVVNLNLPDKSGSEKELYDLMSGKKSMIIFFTTWCEVCSDHWAGLKQMKDAGELEGIEIIGIHLKEDDPKADLQSYFGDWDTLPVLVDEEGMVKEQFEIIGMPTVYLIDEKSEVYRRIQGTLTPDFMESDPFFTD
ncbi:TlpA family protein disulfide reductase [Alteribacter populi]|uniref:TlpA family protein disulfide reductase n=1 Tax=Alteribacter populi TaxID=2011011 RepID=UPI0012FD88F8|nr:redoxin domain-containing protein [Alteribacter populi]